MSVLKRCFAKKRIADLLIEARSSHNLERSLGAVQLVFLGLGAIIGAGIFVLLGPAAAEHAGPAVVFSLALAALSCACAGLCYAELSAMIPISGGAYTFSYAALGEIVAWIVSSMAMLMCLFGSAAVAGGWSGYFVSFLSDYGIHVPPQLCHHLGKTVHLADGSIVHGLLDLPALAVVVLLTTVVYRGAEASAMVNFIVVIVKVSVLMMFVIIGAAYIDPVNWVPFIPQNIGTFGQFGVSGIIGGASSLLLAFSGFDVVATAAQETKNPKRNLPIGILGSLAISAIVYILIALVLTGVVNYTHLNVPQPIALAIEKMHMPWFAAVIKIGAVIGLTSVILALIYAAVRILFTMTNDGLLPKSLAKCHKVYHTPHILTWGCGITVIILSSTLPNAILARMSSFAIAVTFAIVCYSALLMRYRHPELPRPFLCPLMPVVPILGILLFGSLILTSISVIYPYVLAWISLAMLVYFGYGRFHSHLLNKPD